MKSTSYALSLIFFVAAPAFAKVIVFSNADATASLLASSAFKQTLNELHADLTALEAAQIEGSNAFQAFSIKATVLTKTPIGNRNCYLSMDVFSVRDEAAPAGITATKLSAPVIQPVSCEK